MQSLTGERALACAGLLRERADGDLLRRDEGQLLGRRARRDHRRMVRPSICAFAVGLPETVLTCWCGGVRAQGDYQR